MSRRVENKILFRELEEVGCSALILSGDEEVR